MTNLLTPADLVIINSAMQDLVDTFAKQPLTIVHRVTTMGAFGESAIHQDTSFDFLGMVDYTRSRGEKYHNVTEDPSGQQLRDGWRFYLWKAAVDAVVVVDPETDKVILNGLEYIIKFWSPSALFSDLGYLFYEMEISRDTAVSG